MKKAKNKAQYRTTPKTTQSEDTYSIEESAIDTFLFLRELEGQGEGKIKVELLPDFIEQLAVEIEELKRLRDQILR
jgi:hypothetical protein